MVSGQGPSLLKKFGGTILYCLRSMTSRRVHSTVVRPFCKIGKMGDTLLNLYILVTIAQVPPLVMPMVVVGTIYST